MYILAPSIYAADYMKLRQQIHVMEQTGITRLHVDIMDGSFVPNLSFGPDFVQALRKETSLELDVHLMVQKPKQYIRTFAEAGADIITIHLESSDSLEEVLEEIHRFGKRAGVVLKPESPLKELTLDIWQQIDVIQLMTVQPGLKGQHFNSTMLEKITQARHCIEKSGRRIDLEVDGDINENNLEYVLDAGADVIVMGKALFQDGLEQNLLRYQAQDTVPIGMPEEEDRALIGQERKEKSAS